MRTGRRIHLGCFWIILFGLRDANSADDVSNHPAWTILDSFECGYSAADRIIGGMNASLGQFPWIVRLGYTFQDDDEIDFMCGGALVSDRHVLTAAHCVDHSVAPVEFILTSVRAGEHNVGTDPDCELSVCAPPVQDRSVKVIRSHYSFNNPTFHNDIAVLVLDNPLNLNDYVTPICLPRGEQLRDLALGEYVISAGWGKTNVVTEERAEVLQFIALPIVRPDLCVFFEKWIKLGPSQLCAGGQKNKDTCGGDSGGPLMKVFDTPEGPKTFLVGVVSFGTSICGIKKPAVYTSVSHFIKWILDTIINTY
ncbi:CLIP domain-containing serine protease HP8-like [Epargyreus clarus]|uniref:CLIP domain-containing serine protease HP8-like n=1 Tax=Epargyreus clarus TaxID=520877 RepID=UPI003C2C0344